MIITAAKTVSRASVDVSSLPETISVTIRPTSMTVTATASTIEPKGSPTRWATTSAWWTAASTAPASTTPTSASTTPGGLLPHVAASSAAASTGTAVVQRVIGHHPGRRGRRRRGGELPSPPPCGSAPGQRWSLSPNQSESFVALDDDLLVPFTAEVVCANVPIAWIAASLNSPNAVSLMFVVSSQSWW